MGRLTTVSLFESNSLLLATVLMLRIKFNICAFVLGGSPNPCTWAVAPHPTKKIISQTDSFRIKISCAQTFIQESFFVQNADSIQAQQ